MGLGLVPSACPRFRREANRLAVAAPRMVRSAHGDQARVAWRSELRVEDILGAREALQAGAPVGCRVMSPPNRPAHLGAARSGPSSKETDSQPIRSDVQSLRSTAVCRRRRRALRSRDPPETAGEHENVVGATAMDVVTGAFGYTGRFITRRLLQSASVVRTFEALGETARSARER
jgi:hypothetical protein